MSRTTNSPPKSPSLGERSGMLNTMAKRWLFFLPILLPSHLILPPSLLPHPLPPSLTPHPLPPSSSSVFSPTRNMKPVSLPSMLQFCIMPSDKRSPNFIFYVAKTRISDLVSYFPSIQLASFPGPSQLSVACSTVMHVSDWVGAWE